MKNNGSVSVRSRFFQTVAVTSSCLRYSYIKAENLKEVVRDQAQTIFSLEKRIAKLIEMNEVHENKISRLAIENKELIRNAQQQNAVINALEPRVTELEMKLSKLP